MPRLRLARRPLPVALLSSVASGLALSLAFPPVAAWPLALVALVPFLVALHGSSPGRGALLGAAFGVAFYGATLSWILLFGELAWTGLVLASAASVAVFGWFAPVVERPRRPLLSALAIAALWVTADWARGAWPLGGFTWGQLGVSQVDNRLTLRAATVAGVWGVTFLIVLANALVAQAITGPGTHAGRWGRLALAAAVVAAPGAVPFATAAGESLEVAALQVDVRPYRSLAPEEEDRAVTSALVALHRTLAEDPPDLAVWGESALDPGSREDPSFFSGVREAVGDVGVPALAGSIGSGRDGPDVLFNQVLLFERDGEASVVYEKTHLVPFGEYVPWRGALGWISALRQIPYDLAAGRDVDAVSAEGLPPFATPICFENSFPSIDRRMVRAGASFLVVLTNNASYGTSPASAQHLQMSRMRAVETGRWVVHGAVSGISAFLDPTGRIVADRGLFDEGVLRATIETSQARTPYVRLGDWLPLASLLLLLGLAAVPRLPAAEPRPLGPLPERPRVLVILPTYEERRTIGTVLAGLLSRPEAIDALVVDDSSPDGTAAAVREVAARDPRVRLRVRPAKAGLGSAYVEGFRVALEEGYDLVVEMDSDLSHDPAELGGLLEAARDNHLVIGSRYVPGGSVTNWSRTRLALSRGGNLYARWMLGLPVHDATSGFRVYRADALAELLRAPLRTDGYGFQVELVDRACRSGFRLGERPITFREREHGVSKISRRIVFEALWLITLWGLRRRLRPPPQHR